MVLLDDLVVAYRKAKVDLYRSTEPRLFDLVEYEESLAENLAWLRDRIDEGDRSWVTKSEFVGGYTFVPKSVFLEDRHPSVLWSDPADHWRARAEAASDGERPLATFRLMSRCSIDFHVLSTLWLITVGDRLDAALSKTAFGNSLRREPDGTLNRLAPGSFRSYLSPYRKWRDDGFAVMQSELDAGKSLVTMTADATAFYHRLDPAFLLDDRFLDRLGVADLSDEERHLHLLFVEALQAWAALVSEAMGSIGGGLPVGLPASGVVANVALAEFDRLAADEFKPLYYGRYVDDIILVLEDSSGRAEPLDIWQWLADRSHGLITYEPAERVAEGRAARARFVPDYLEGSEVIFENEKNKVFHLIGDTGRFVLGSIKREINERASEWRALPSIHTDPKHIGTDLAAMTTLDGRRAATLRESDRVAWRRSAFAIRLRDYEVYERILDTASWAKHRRAFFAAITQQLIVLPTYFELAGYVPRLIKLAVACDDMRALTGLVRALARLVEEVRGTCDVAVASFDSSGRPAEQAEDTLQRWCRQIASECIENLAAAYTGRRLKRGTLEPVADALAAIAPSEAAHLRATAWRGWRRRLFLRDLAHVPYRFALFRRDLIRPRGLAPYVPRTSERVDLPLPNEVMDGLDELVDWLDPTDVDVQRLGDGHELPGLAFATRPFNVLDLYLALRGRSKFGLPPPSAVKCILRAIRGYSLAKLPKVTEGGRRLSVRSNTKPGARCIALGMVLTTTASMEAAALGRHDLTRSRYEQLVRVIDEAIERRPRVDYLLLPELSVPPMWFVEFGRRLEPYGISLVAGIDYRRDSRSRVVHNQVWAALRVDDAGAPFFSVYRQDKQRAAPGEERMLRELADLSLEPEIGWKRGQPPVIVHGDFRFALLVCSELTNIGHRAAMRGKVDALLVPEWNRDLRTFGALIESAALDIHAFIAQANHRDFGDARIRGPFSEEWRRDVVRVRGGTHDYVVVGRIEYHALRREQSRHVVLDGEFKPVPDGFAIAPERRMPGS